MGKLSTTTVSYPVLNEASGAINLWANTRENASDMVNLFNGGIYFEISTMDYYSWISAGAPPSHLHGYLGKYTPPSGGASILRLYAVDSITDSNPVEGNEPAYNDKIRIMDYNHGVLQNMDFSILPFNTLTPDPLTPEEALRRSTSWSLCSNTWLLQNAGIEMAQILSIPFSDLTTLFKDEGATSVICLLALKKNGNNSTGHQMEFILWGYKDTLGVMGWLPKDIVRPVPPFGGSGGGMASYQLLDYST